MLREFDNTMDVIIVVRYPKSLYANVNTDKPINLSKEYKEDVILITQLQYEGKYYVKRVQVLKDSIPKLYCISLGQFTPGFQNEVQGDPYYDTNSDLFDCLWLMEKLRLNSSGIPHTSNPLHAGFHAPKEMFNLHQGKTDSMDSLYKRFYSSLAT